VPQVARGVIGAVVVGHYPLNHHPARLCMQDLEHFFFGWEYLSLGFSAAQTIVFVVSSLSVAVVVSDRAFVGSSQFVLWSLLSPSLL
jgi:solute carrier family 38 (sodium-coupled neutral amino acid transporter), member 7/8